MSLYSLAEPWFMTLPPMTDYFENEVLRMRAYLKLEWCMEALENPIHRELQEDGRIRHWVYSEPLGKYL